MKIPPGRAEPAAGASLASGEVTNSAKRRQPVQKPGYSASKGNKLWSLRFPINEGRAGVAVMARRHRSGRGRSTGQMHDGFSRNVGSPVVSVEEIPERAGGVERIGDRCGTEPDGRCTAVQSQSGGVAASSDREMPAERGHRVIENPRPDSYAAAWVGSEIAAAPTAPPNEGNEVRRDGRPDGSAPP